MRLLNKLKLRVRSLMRRDEVDGELSDELRFHLDQQIEENIAQGMSREEARFAALRTVGGISQIEEECRDERSVNHVETTLQDLKYALRGLRKTPGFTLVAVLSLALGIGANTAVFSVVYPVLARALPYPEANRVMRVGRGWQQQWSATLVDYVFLKRNAQSFSAIAAYGQHGDQTLTADGSVEWIQVLGVSSGFFESLGIAPMMGREFGPDEMRVGGARSIIISNALWRKAFGGDPSAIGKTAMIAGTGFTVIGVLPEGFWFPAVADAYLPYRPSGTVSDQGMNSLLVARLKPGVSLKQANEELAALTAAWRQANPDLAAGLATGFGAIGLQESLTGDVRITLLLLFGAVALLLVIACSNLASLLFARMSARQREIAVRLALGSSPGRLLRLFIVENAVIVATGGALGLIGAYLSLNAFVHLFPLELPAQKIAVNAEVLAFTFAIMLATVLTLSAAPLMTASKVKVDEALKSGRFSASGMRQRARGFLVTVEIAMATALLITASLLIGSLYRLHQEKLGFVPQGLITFWAPPSRGRTGNAEQLRQFETALRERIRQIPGVHRVAAANLLPLTSQNNYPVQRVGHAENSEGGMEIRYVTPDYFETMGIPIVRGRTIGEADSPNSTPVVAVNETVAKKWWGEGNPLGDRIVMGMFRGRVLSDGDPPREVIAVIGNTKSVLLKEKARPTIYIPVAQSNDTGGGMSWAVRANLTPDLIAQLRRAVADVDPRQRVMQVRTMEEIVASTMTDSRFDAWLFGGFAGIALLLTAIGEYGLLAFFVAQRTSEFGMRVALGASRLGIAGLVLKQGLRLIVLGVVIGLGGAYALTKSFAKLLYGVKADDPFSFIAVPALLLIVGLLASYIPGRRALRVDPITALRYE